MPHVEPEPGVASEIQRGVLPIPERPYAGPGQVRRQGSSFEVPPDRAVASSGGCADAANAVRYWNLDSLRESYEESLRAVDEDPESEIAALTEDPEADYAEYWERAKTNLLAGRIRLVFVADVIPAELQRVVEFLNERMSPTEVIAVEIRQYTGGGEQMLVPASWDRPQRRERGRRLARREDRDDGTSRHSWRRSNAEPAAWQPGCGDILGWSGAHFSRLGWGKGAVDGTVALVPVQTERPTGRSISAQAGRSRSSSTE